jgi:hypothetical protein
VSRFVEKFRRDYDAEKPGDRKGHGKVKRSINLIKKMVVWRFGWGNIVKKQFSC